VITGTALAIMNNEVVVTTKGHLELPKSAKWLQANHQLLFVRKVYSEFFDSVFNELERDEDGNYEMFAVTGQPGIGKSMFGYVVKLTI